MNYLDVFFPTIMYILGIILLVILIILGIRLIQMLDKVEKVVDNIENKVNTLNGAFSLIDKATDSIALISESVVGTVSGFIGRVVSKIKKEDKEL